MTKRNFSVYIIESPRADELYHKRFEGESLEKTLKLSGISASHRLAVTREAFIAAFLVGLKEYFIQSSTPPIIHISAHGNENGIQLSDNYIVDWEELKSLLIPINRILKGSLLVCMSSCNGLHGSKMAMNDDNFPFMDIIGSSDKPTWGETNIAFSTFYHLFAKGEDIFLSVEAMKKASGNNTFSIDFSNLARQRYLSDLKLYTSRVNKESVLSKLEEVIPKSENTLSKALR